MCLRSNACHAPLAVQRSTDSGSGAFWLTFLEGFKDFIKDESDRPALDLCRKKAGARGCEAAGCMAQTRLSHEELAPCLLDDWNLA